MGEERASFWAARPLKAIRRGMGAAQRRLCRAQFATGACARMLIMVATILFIFGLTLSKTVGATYTPAMVPGWQQRGAAKR